MLVCAIGSIVEQTGPIKQPNIFIGFFYYKADTIYIININSFYAGEYMFGWLIKILKHNKILQPTYQKYFILLPGQHTLLLEDIKGISLKEVPRSVWDAHKGIKYCISCEQQSNLKNSLLWKSIQHQTSMDLKKLLFNKTLFKNNTYQLILETATIILIDDRN